MTDPTSTLSQTSPLHKTPSKSGKSNCSGNADPMNRDKFPEMNMETEGAPPRITEEQISARAHEIWEEAGRMMGNDIRNWLQAEEELRHRTTDKRFR